jgi:hypothetical protein
MSIENINTPQGYLQSTPYKDSSKKPTVATPCHEYEEMAGAWELPEALMGGTREMRKEPHKWLPREPREKVDAHRIRVQRSVLYNAYKRTVMTLCGLPFASPVAVEKIKPDLAYLIEDADSMGSDITSLAFSLLKDQVHLGLTYILVDMPAIEGKVTIKQQKDYKIRPYFSHISPTNLISWSYEKKGGLIELTEIRIKEEVYEKDGWGEEEYDQIRVVTPEAFEIHREVNKGEWQVIESIPNNLGYIPLVTIYGNQEEFMTAYPPMEDLAWMNLRHYQQLSDHDTILHVASVPIMFGTGFDDGEMDGISVGPNTLITTSKENAKLIYVEHSGAAIGAAEKSLERVEERMAALGADLVVRKSVDRQTATSRKIDQSESISFLQIAINNLESGLQQAIAIAGDWIDVDGDNTIVNIGDNLDAGAGGPNTIDLLAAFLIENQGMNLEQAANELKRRGVLSDTFTPLKKEVETPAAPVVQPIEGEMPSNEEVPGETPQQP